MSENTLTVYEKCKHLRLDPHSWYPHDYNREIDPSEDEKLLIGGKWHGQYWCPGGREIVLHLDAIRSALQAASESLIEPERYRVWYKEALAALEVSDE
jgi:hypothetical protein